MVGMALTVNFGGPDLSQMEPTDQLDAADRRLPEGRVRRSAKRNAASRPSSIFVANLSLNHARLVDFVRSLQTEHRIAAEAAIIDKAQDAVEARSYDERRELSSEIMAPAMKRPNGEKMT